MELYRLAESCEYDALKDEMIRDRLVVGIRNSALSQQLQLDAELTLEKAKKKVRQREAVDEQQKELKEPGSKATSTSLEEVQHGRYRRAQGAQKQRFRGRSKTTTPPSSKATCTHCGKSPHPPEKCPAREADCRKCGKKGHYSAQCFSKRVAEVEGESLLGSAYLDSLGSNQTTQWTATVKLNDRKIDFKLDTGAEVTAISTETHKQLQKPRLYRPSMALYGPSRQPLKTVGQFWGDFSHKNKTVKQRVFVVDGLKSNLLGLPAIVALDLAIRLDSTETDSPIATEVKEQFPTVFQGLGNLGEEFEIHLKQGATPKSLFAPRHVPMPLRPIVQEELNRMESIGVIFKVDKPTP